MGTFEEIFSEVEVLLQTNCEFFHGFLLYVEKYSPFTSILQIEKTSPSFARGIWSWEGAEHQKCHSVPCLRSSLKTEKFSFTTCGKS